VSPLCDELACVTSVCYNKVTYLLNYIYVYTYLLTYLLNSLHTYIAANIVQHPCSDSSHVTAPYKLSFYYYYTLVDAA